MPPHERKTPAATAHTRLRRTSARHLARPPRRARPRTLRHARRDIAARARRRRKLEAAAAAAAVPRAGEWAVSLKQRPSTAADAAPPAPLARAATLKREGARAYPERARVAGTLAAAPSRVAQQARLTSTSAPALPGAIVPPTSPPSALTPSSSLSALAFGDPAARKRAPHHFRASTRPPTRQTPRGGGGRAAATHRRRLLRCRKEGRRRRRRRREGGVRGVGDAVASGPRHHQAQIRRAARAVGRRANHLTQTDCDGSRPHARVHAVDVTAAGEPGGGGGGGRGGGRRRSGGGGGGGGGGGAPRAAVARDGDDVPRFFPLALFDDTSYERGTAATSGWSRRLAPSGEGEWAAVTIESYDERAQLYTVRWSADGGGGGGGTKRVSRLNLRLEDEDEATFARRLAAARQMQQEGEAALRQSRRVARRAEEAAAGAATDTGTYSPPQQQLDSIVARVGKRAKAAPPASVAALVSELRGAYDLAGHAWAIDRERPFAERAEREVWRRRRPSPSRRRRSASSRPCHSAPPAFMTAPSTLARDAPRRLFGGAPCPSGGEAQLDLVAAVPLLAPPPTDGPLSLPKFIAAHAGALRGGGTRHTGHTRAQHWRAVAARCANLDLHDARRGARTAAVRAPSRG